MKLTDLIGKQIFSLYEGEPAGTISGIVFNQNITKIHAFKVFDQEENEYELPLANVLGMSDNVIISNKNKLLHYIDYKRNSPMQKEVFDETAKSLGKVVDIDIEQNGNINYFITTIEKKLEPRNVYTRKDFVYYSAKKVNISAFRPRKQNIANLSKIKVNILNVDNSAEFHNFTPSKLTYNTETVLGKVAKCDLVGINNEVIVKANQTITQKVIADAIKHNRLNQLFFIAV